MEELLAVFNEDGEPTGEAVKRSEAHKGGILHGAAHVYIYRIVAENTDSDSYEDTASDGHSKEPAGRVEILLQRRSLLKDSYAGLLDISTAGHVSYGDTLTETARKEVGEELGIDVPAERFHLAYTRRYSFSSLQHGEEFRDEEINGVFFLRMDDLDIEKELTLQESELSEVLWMDAETARTRCLSGDPDYSMDPTNFDHDMRYLAELLG